MPKRGRRALVPHECSKVNLAVRRRAADLKPHPGFRLTPEQTSGPLYHCNQTQLIWHGPQQKSGNSKLSGELLNRREDERERQSSRVRSSTRISVHRADPLFGST
jgi:hypothetical protein